MTKAYIVLDSLIDRQVQTGQWLPAIGDGYGGVGYVLFPNLGMVIDWLGPNLFECEYGDVVVQSSDSVIASRVLPTRRLFVDDIRARQLAAECAHHVLPYYEKSHPRDKRLHEVLQAVKAYCGKHMSLEELKAAAEMARVAVTQASNSVSRAVAKAAFSAASHPTEEREAYYADSGSDAVLAARNAACNARWAVEFAEGRGAMVKERLWQGQTLSALLDQRSA